MIGYIKGDVTAVFLDRIILENNGIGYQIFTSLMALNQIHLDQKAVKFFTYLHVREEELSLFGFPSQNELEMFRMLITVNGIGPKAALAILSVLSVDDLQYAIISGDVKAITRANGVGAKGANRVIMELKDKIKIIDDCFDHSSDMNKDSFVEHNQQSIQDTVLALVSLGYSDSDALRAIKQIENAKELSSEELLKMALKKIF